MRGACALFRAGRTHAPACRNDGWHAADRVPAESPLASGSAHSERRVAAAQQCSLRRSGLFGRIARNPRLEDWPVYVALLPGVVIGVVAVIDFATGMTRAERQVRAASNVETAIGESDGYVQGLAKRGIAVLPEH